MALGGFCVFWNMDLIPDMEILLIEDDMEACSHIAYALNGEGHTVIMSHNGLDGLERARTGNFSALIVDRMLPGLDGLTLVRRLRSEGEMVPILFLTTMSGLDDRVEGLKAGGDDYLTKPFAFSELLARIYAITRRKCQTAEPVELTVGDLAIDLIRRTVRRAGKRVDLQAQEFRLLEFLMRNAGRTVTRAMLLENVWNLHFDPRTNIVETHMSRLRSKIRQASDSDGDLIQTVRSTGYILAAS